MSKVNEKQPNSRMCFICGLKNIAGVKARFYETDDGKLVCLFTPRDEHQSYPGRVHGGIASAILDETIGRAIQINSKDIWGVTVDLDIKFRKPLPLNIELKCAGWITRDTRILFEGEGIVYTPDGEPAVSAKGRYMKMSIDKIADSGMEDLDWMVVPDHADPDTIELP